jgi:NTE family protein
MVGLFWQMAFAEQELSYPAILVLGSGGSKGVAHVGVLEALTDLRVEPKAIVGCSAGAVIATLFAQSLDVKMVKDTILPLSREDLIHFSIWQKKALSTRKQMEVFLDSVIQIELIEEMPIPLVIVATNFETGQAVYFTKGSVKQALLASTALPGLFPPYQTEQGVFIDGGCSDPLPVQGALNLQMNYPIIASDISTLIDSLSHDHLLGVLRKSFEILYQNLAAPSRSRADILLKPKLTLYSPIEEGRNLEVYEEGKVCVTSQKKRLLEVLEAKRPSRSLKTD